MNEHLTTTVQITTGWTAVWGTFKLAEVNLLLGFIAGISAAVLNLWMLWNYHKKQRRAKR
jgi:hypothetical protein